MIMSHLVLNFITQHAQHIPYYLSLPVLYAQTLLHIAGQCLYRYHHLAQVHNYSPYRIIASMLTFQ